MLSRFTTIGIVLFWLVSMSLVWRQHYGGTRAKSLETSVTQGVGSDTEEWFGIYLHEKKVGYSSQNTRKVNENLLFQENTLLKLPLAGKTQEVLINSSFMLDKDLVLKNFSFLMTAGDYETNLTGYSSDNRLIVKIKTNEKESNVQFPFSQKIYLPSTIPLILKSQDHVVPNGEYRLSIFDPFALYPADLLIQLKGTELTEIKGKKVPLRRVEISFKGVKSNMWLNLKWEVVKEDGLMGMMILREDKSEALELPEEKDISGDILTGYAVPVDRTIGEPRNVKYLRLQLLNIQQANFDLNDSNQKVISTDPLQVEINLKADFVASPPDSNDLMNTPFIQSSDLRIRRKAQEIASGEKDPWKISLKLCNWVYKNLTKDAQVSIPSALDVLRAKKGDCNEHTALFTALARSLGIPTRFNVGLVYLRERFFYHAWPSVFVGKKWIALDPTFGQEIADATHLKLLSGGYEKQVELVRAIGKLKIHVLEYRM